MIRGVHHKYTECDNYNFILLKKMQRMIIKEKVCKSSYFFYFVSYIKRMIILFGFNKAQALVMRSNLKILIFGC